MIGDVGSDVHLGNIKTCGDLLYGVSWVHFHIFTNTASNSKTNSALMLRANLVYLLSGRPANLLEDLPYCLGRDANSHANGRKSVTLDPECTDISVPLRHRLLHEFDTSNGRRMCLEKSTKCSDLPQNVTGCHGGIGSD
jgi:hypothetical protein